MMNSIKINSFLLHAAIALYIFFPARPAIAVPPVIIGGENGVQWQGGGGELPALVIQSSRRGVEQTNTPGGVVAFDPDGRLGWIFPQRADTTVNIALGADSDARGGSIASPNRPSINEELKNIIDDNGNSALDLRPTPGAISAQVLGIIIDLDLGARFGVNRFRFFPRNAAEDFPAEDFPYQNDFMRGYEIFINDGTEATQVEGVPIPSTVAVNGQNEEAVVDLSIPPQYVRFVRLKSIATRGFDIAEFQVFGTGFVPEARYVSNIFDFGVPALLGKLRWVQEALGDPALSRVLVRTRTGVDPQPVEFNKIRPGENIFREGGGVLAGEGDNPLFSATGGAQRTNRPEVPWLSAEEVDDPELKGIVETVLDNEQVDAREARRFFIEELTRQQQELLTIGEEEYSQLGRQGKADPGIVRDDVINWSPWSPPYPAAAIVAAEELADNRAGVDIVSPSPRRYFQFSIEFLSADFAAAAGVGGLAFEAVQTPFADELIAEIAPRQAALGQPTSFVYGVYNRAPSGQVRGFDRLRIDTPLPVEVVRRIEIQRPGAEAERADFAGVDLGQLPAVQGEFAVLAADPAGFVVGFPRISEDGAVLLVEFENAVLRFGTLFSGQALDSQTDTQVGQGVTAGNAGDMSGLGYADGDKQPVGVALDGNLAVKVATTRDLLINLKVEPAVFSPNGDQVNDQTIINYDITNIARLSPVEVVVFDLAGRPLRRLQDQGQLSGRYRLAWDGTDDAGKRLPAGHYMLSVELKAGTGIEREVGLVRLVY